MPVIPQSQASRQLAELLGVAQQWGPTAARVAGGTPVTAPLGEATAARLEGRTPTWEELLLSAGLAAIPLGAVLGAAKRKGGSALGRVLGTGKKILRESETYAPSIMARSYVSEKDALRFSRNRADAEAAHAMSKAAQEAIADTGTAHWVQGQPRTVRAYRGGGEPTPDRGTFLSETIPGASAYMSTAPPLRKEGTSVQRWQRALRQYDVTVQNPRVFPDALEPEHAIRQARTLLESSVPTDLTMRQLEAAGITAKQVDAALRSGHPYREADKLMHRYLQHSGYDAAVFPISGQIQLVEARPRLPK